MGYTPYLGQGVSKEITTVWCDVSTMTDTSTASMSKAINALDGRGGSDKGLTRHSRECEGHRDKLVTK
jgi:hypothetical protein